MALSANDIFWRTLNDNTFETYDRCETFKEPPLKIVKTTNSFRISMRSHARLTYAVLSLLLSIVRPYLLLVLPAIYFDTILAIAEMRIETIASTSVLMYLLLLLWHMYSWQPQHSPRTDGALGSAPHGTLAPLGWTFDHSSPLLMRLHSALLPISDYEAKATPWILGINGDALTLLPFLLFNPPRHNYTRRWLRVPRAEGPNNPEDLAGCSSTDKGEAEAVAVDVLTPKSGFDPARPVLVLLAGLTGGSNEGYVRDMVQEAVHVRGMTAAVLIARGTNMTPCASNSVFHGARISDFAAFVSLMRKAALSPHETSKAFSKPMVYGAGVSMGGIILPNYLAKAGQSALLDGAAVLSGSLRTSVTSKFWHSRYLWQPLLTKDLKDQFVAPQPSLLAQRGCDVMAIGDSCDLTDFDARMVATYHGYRDITHYYDDMSAASADGKNIAKKGDCEERLNNICVPTLVLHALDDPIIHADSIPVDTLVAPRNGTRSNVMVLMTQRGGHIGWPTGWFPWIRGFQFSTTLTLSFIETLHDENKNSGRNK